MNTFLTASHKVCSYWYGQQGFILGASLITGSACGGHVEEDLRSSRAKEIKYDG